MGADRLYGRANGLPDFGLLFGGERLVPAVCVGLADRSSAGRPGILQDVLHGTVVRPREAGVLDGGHPADDLPDYRARRA